MSASKMTPGRWWTAADGRTETLLADPDSETDPNDPPCPDIGQQLSRFLVHRAIGRTFDELARAFNLSYEQVRLLLDRHGEPPRLAGAQAADMARALAGTPAYAGCTHTTRGPAPNHAAPTHASRSHAALETDQESA
ncbi:MAG: hypothetical protein O9320_08680 [Magnetospirillum sp.]|nr:hypothetical protein [Magnetospirillum sp.]